MVAPARVPRLRLPQTDRPYRWPVLVSVAVHALLIGLFVRAEIQQQMRPAAEQRSPGAPGQRGGGGGRTIRIELPAYQAAEEPRVAPPVETPPVPRPVPAPRPDITVPRVEIRPQTGTVTPGVDLSSLGGQGPGQGGGIGTGIGPGAGADTGRGTGGEGGDVFPPTPRYTILPPLPQPASMRGRTIRVHFWVNAQGRVTRVQLEPDITDAEYRQQFLSMMKEYVFNPARKVDGTAVDGELVTTFTL